MHLLIIGGSVFLGRALVEAALAQGHTITLFNRGRSNPGLFPGVTEIHGDRSNDLHLLQGQRWDAVIDTCGYVPRVVRQSAELLASATDHYTFISTLSVYADTSTLWLDESGALATLADETVEEVTGETYGPLKALCERVVEQAFPTRSLIIRPGLIVGPYDPSDRFSYWPWRIAQGGEVLAPGRPARPIQFIDVRDLAEWTLRMVEREQTGQYNAVGPDPRPTMEELLHTARHVSGSDARFTWVSEEFLQEQQVGPWMAMPLWIPESDPNVAGFFATNINRALAAGLTFRSVEETLRATLDWLPLRPSDREWRAGISREREAELLALWHQRGA